VSTWGRWRRFWARTGGDEGTTDMTKQVSQRQEKEILERWLKRHGFTANPFAEREAGRERRLDEYFVPGPYYDDIKGTANDPRTCFVFAARGCGKSAYRVMIERSCRPWDSQSDILAIPYTDFNAIVEEVNGDLSEVALHHHLEAILREGVLSLFWTLAQQPLLFDGLWADEQGFFRWLVDNYCADLLSEDTTSSPAGKYQLSRGARRSVEELFSKNQSLEETVTELVVKLVNVRALLPEGKAAPVRLLKKFVDLAVTTGYKAVYVLFDGIDEFFETANNPALCVSFLLPLVSNLKLMEETPHLAFKFFLPTEIVAEMRKDPALRFDRLPHYELEWQDSDLLEMLLSRIQAFNTKGIESLGEIATEDIAADVDQELAKLAYGSPRRLLLLGDFLLAAHCYHPTAEETQLTRDDLKAARERYTQEYGTFVVPPLRVDDRQQRVLIGEREIIDKPTPSEYKLLLYLYQAKGKLRSKDEVINAVYSDAKQRDGISDEAFDSLIFRLRSKIERDPKNPVYLVTERGRGYRLANIK